jgi:hypothetical protein
MVASRVYDALQIPKVERLQLLDGWLEKFKLRHEFGFVNFHDEVGSALLMKLKPNAIILLPCSL